MLKLIGFKQISRYEFLFEFDRKLNNCFCIIKDEVPKDILIDKDGINFHPENCVVEVSGKSLKVNVLDKFEPKLSEYSIFIIIKNHQSIIKKFMPKLGFFSKSKFEDTNYFELVRQPEEWLKLVFNYSREFGYSILGRRAIAVGSDNLLSEQSDIIFNSLPDISSIVGFDEISMQTQGEEPKELQIARKIIQLLWSGEMFDAPTDLPYSDFINQKFEEKLLQIHNGTYPVSCQGMRDMFLHAALGFPGLKARAVNAHNYRPQFENLISYAHATAEVYLENAGRWVLTDPWFGILLKDECGEYLSAEKLLTYGSSFEVVPLVDQIVQSRVGVTGELSKTTRRPVEEKLDIYTFTNAGHIPNFKIYFNQLEYGYVKCATN